MSFKKFTYSTNTTISRWNIPFCVSISTRGRLTEIRCFYSRLISSACGEPCSVCLYDWQPLTCVCVCLCVYVANAWRCNWPEQTSVCRLILTSARITAMIKDQFVHLMLARCKDGSSIERILRYFSVFTGNRMFTIVFRQCLQCNFASGNLLRNPRPQGA